MSSPTIPRRLSITAVAAILSLGLVACNNSDTTTTEDPSVSTIPEPAAGAADDVVDLTEDGYDLDDGNVPGTERDAEVDQAERND